MAEPFTSTHAPHCGWRTIRPSLCAQTLGEFLSGTPCPAQTVYVCVTPPRPAEQAQALRRMNEAFERCARRFGPTACYR